MRADTIWADAYEQGWRDRDGYGHAESWPLVFDTPNPHTAENALTDKAEAWDACATELQDMGGKDMRAMAFILMATNPYKENP